MLGGRCDEPVGQAVGPGPLRTPCGTTRPQKSDPPITQREFQCTGGKAAFFSGNPRKRLIRRHFKSTLWRDPVEAYARAHF
jgi:hypothetical protein